MNEKMENSATEIEIMGEWEADINLNYDEYDEDQMDSLFDGEIDTLMPDIASTSEFVKNMLRGPLLDGTRSGILNSGVSWDVDYNKLTLDGEKVRFQDLSEATQEEIVDRMLDGYTDGEIVEYVVVEKTLDAMINKAQDKAKDTANKANQTPNQSMERE